MAKGDLIVRPSDDLKKDIKTWGDKRGLSINKSIIVLASEKLLDEKSKKVD